MAILEFLPSKEINLSGVLIYLAETQEGQNLISTFLTQEEINFIGSQFKKGIEVVEIHTPHKTIFILSSLNAESNDDIVEKYRRKGAALCHRLTALKHTSVTIFKENSADTLLAFTEGIVLANYQFLKYKSGTKNSLTKLFVSSELNLTDKVAELTILLDAVYKTRDLVNEPVLFLTAEQLSKEIETIGKEAGFSTEIFNKSKIQSLKMGGLLAVNEGSPNPPTFTILEYKPKNPINKNPIVLVGKGVVYDTGGLSLKPTEHSMDMMKCDMAGAAAVAGAFYAVAKNNLPIHLIGLIPATENRPGGNAITPGDIITMHNGKTVEVLNTDAEGRLILADALSYAKKYDPELVIDLATLTGSAARAIGKEAIVFMGTADETTKKEFTKAGFETFERLVEFPLWEDYDQYIQSDIADLKNIGGNEAGAITAGKFMQHFTSYPWLHLDIAGGAFMTSPFHYWVKGGTGLGVKLLYNFLKNKINQ
ncbi:MAG TPA: leucyl aminopeptidase [Cytophagaceae bacterium]|jgi:leucyl aminopeptidase|nr:leucyl aminopeptidase [Cytophagaceae bacterium]